MRKRVTPLEKEWKTVERQEQMFLQKRMEKKDSRLNQFLGQKVPPTLQKTLNTAFSKAFYLIFEKGTGVIEKTYNRDELEKNYKINDYAARIRNDQKSMRVFSKKAAGAGNLNTLLSGVSGIGLGVLGIGIPDIVLFTGLMLKSVYEIALDYGFDYKENEEKLFILLLIQGAVSYGGQLQKINDNLNHYIETGAFQSEEDLNRSIEQTAGSLSGELLYMKFLQGIPVVGAAGGAYDLFYMKQVTEYARMKYHRRFCQRRMQET